MVPSRPRSRGARATLFWAVPVDKIIGCQGACFAIAFRIMPRPALGLIETSGIDGAIQATRAASEAGQVVIVSAERSDADHMTVKIEGDWSAVQAAIEAGARAADKAGQLLSMHVIPRSDNGVSPILPYPRFVDRYRPGGVASSPKKTPTGKRSRRARPTSGPTPEKSRVAHVSVPFTTPKTSVVEPAPTVVAVSEPTPVGAEPGTPGSKEPAWDELQAMAVVKLRKFARTIPDLPIKGREISKANKQQLLEAIDSVRKGKS